MEEGEEGNYDGVSDADIDGLINRANKAESINVELTNALSGMSMQKRDENFLHHQISPDDMLEKLEHFYRGDYQGIDENGDMAWLAQDDKDLKTFNEFGVTSLMEIITKYIDKNTILSFYSSQRIYEILADLGDDLILFLLCNYEKMGMDTYFKKTKFRLVITTTVHIIESAYMRALQGRTMEEVNQSKVIGQFGSLPERPQQQPTPQGRISRFFGNR